jgi:hypothetical protein
VRSDFDRPLGSVLQLFTALENFIEFRKLSQDRSNHIVLTRYVGAAPAAAGRRRRARMHGYRSRGAARAAGVHPG